MNLIKYVCGFLFCLASLSSIAQPFEGTLTYTVDFQVDPVMARRGVTRQSLIEGMKADGTWPDTVHVTYKGGNYRTFHATVPLTWSIFRADSTAIYSFTEGPRADFCTVTDASIDYEQQLTGTPPIITKLDTSIDIGTRRCAIVEVQWGSGIYRYYYEPGFLPVDPEQFIGHVHDGFAEYLRIAASLPIRIVKIIPGSITTIQTLVEVRPRLVEDILFAIPRLVIVPDQNLVPGNQRLMRIVRD